MVATNGSMQADAFLFQKLVQPGDLVVVEAPTYDRTLLALRELGAEILAIPLEADGIDVDALEIALQEGARPKLAHIIPNFQNPAGCTLSLEKRRSCSRSPRSTASPSSRTTRTWSCASRASRSHDAVDGRGRSRRLRVVLLEDGLPGIRVGYLVGPADVIGAIRKLATNTYISPNMVAQSIVAEFCDSGAIERSIETVKGALRERRDATAEALERHIPDATFVKPQGGYFLWVDLPEGSDVAALAAGAEERGVVFVKGSDFLIEGGGSSLRIAYSAVPPDQIEEAIARVAEAYRELAGAAA